MEGKIGSTTANKITSKCLGTTKTTDYSQKNASHILFPLSIWALNYGPYKSSRHMVPEPTQKNPHLSWTIRVNYVSLGYPLIFFPFYLQRAISVLLSCLVCRTVQFIQTNSIYLFRFRWCCWNPWKPTNTMKKNTNYNQYSNYKEDVWLSDVSLKECFCALRLPPHHLRHHQQPYKKQHHYQQWKNLY